MLTRKELTELNEKRWLGQICLVSNPGYESFMEMVKTLTEKLQIGPWTLLYISDDSTQNIRWKGEPIEGPWKYYVAITNIGTMELEIIAPESGPNPYDRFLKEKGPGLHHVKLGIKDNDALRAEALRLAELVGKEILYKGEYGLDHHYYIDTYDDIGAYIEMGNFADMPEPPRLIGYYPEV